MSDPIRAAVVGLGMMGRHHVRVLRSLPGVDLVAVVDPAGDVHGVADGIVVLDDIATLLEGGVDLCVVAVPTEEHEAIGLQLASAEVHTLIEKPLADSPEAGARLVAAFGAASVVACVGHIERFNPAVTSMHDRLAAGELGDLYQISTERQGPFPDRVRDVGVVKDLATHDLDLAAWVARSPFADVAARTAHRTGRPHEDLVAVLGHLEDGTITNHLVNWLSPRKRRRIEVVGERGCFVADTLTADLTWYANGSVRAEWDDVSHFRGVTEGDVVRYAIPKPEPLRVELEQLCAAVRGYPARYVSLEEGLRTLIVAEAVLRSAATGTTQTVAP